jgi:DNA-binding CsgD family transcriptional regulator/tetratricopeptide (TPR) repeat protein
MLETIRQYAAEQLAVSEDQYAAVRDRHQDFYLALAERAAPLLEGVDQQDRVQVLELDHQNLRAAFNWAHGRGDAETAQRIVAALFWYLVIGGRVREGQKLCRLALELDGAPPGVRARALTAAIQVAQLAYDFSFGSLADEAVELAREAGDGVSEGRALYLRGWARHVTDPDDGLRSIQAGIDRLRAVHDRWGLAMALLYSGMVQDSRPARARPPLEECEELCRDIGDRYVLSTARYNLARALLAQGRTSEAESMLRAVVDHTRRTSDTFNLTIALSELALVRAVRGDFDEALSLLEQNIRLIGTGRAPWISHESQAFGVLGSVLHMTGRNEEARPACETALAKSLEVAIFKDYIALELANLAQVEHALGEIAAATKHIEEASIVAQECGVLWPIAVATSIAAQLAGADGNVDAAERLAHDALAMNYELGYHYRPNGTFDVLETIAGLSTDPSTAARLLGVVDAAYNRADLVRAPAAAKTHDAMQARLRGELGGDAFDSVYAEGSEMTLDAAVEYARRGRGKRRRPSTGWESLTPTELEVAKLVAEGLSNPQIADRMFISRKTVTIHLTHVFAKLGLPSRSALSAEAVRQGVVAQKGTT